MNERTRAGGAAAFGCLCLILLAAGCRQAPEPGPEVAPDPEGEPPIIRQVLCAAVSADGRQILTAETGETWAGVKHAAFVTLWDASVEQPAVPPAQPSADPPGVIWSASLAEQGEEDLARTTLHGVAFDAAGRLVYAIGPTGRVWALDRATGRRVSSFLPGEVHDIPREEPGGRHVDADSGLFLPGGKHFVSSNGERLEVWDLETGKSVRTINTAGTEARGYTGELLAARPDGARVLARHAWHDSATRERLIEWDWRTGKITATLGGTNQERIYAGYLPDRDGLWCWSLETHGLSFWDLRTGKEKAALPGLKGANARLAVAPDGARIASDNWDRERRLGQTRVHDPVSGQVVKPKTRRQPPEGNPLFFPDGRRLLIYGRPQGFWEKKERRRAKALDERRLLVWDCQTERLTTLASPRGMRPMPKDGPGLK